MAKSNTRIKIINKYCDYKEYRDILKKIDIMPILHDLKHLTIGNSSVIYSCITHEIPVVIPENCLHLINHKTQTHEKGEIRDSPIKVQGPIGTITTGEKRAGTTIQGRRSSTSISSGRVSYKEVYSFR
jgi:hypothetical protein